MEFKLVLFHVPQLQALELVLADLRMVIEYLVEFKQLTLSFMFLIFAHLEYHEELHE